MIIPDVVRYLWDWYFAISDSVRRVRDGACEPIPPGEFAAWVTLTGTIVRPGEYAILRAMDRAFCAEMDKELADFRARERDRMTQGGKGGNG